MLTGCARSTVYLRSVSVGVLIVLLGATSGAADVVSTYELDLPPTILQNVRLRGVSSGTAIAAINNATLEQEISSQIDLTSVPAGAQLFGETIYFQVVNFTVLSADGRLRGPTGAELAVIEDVGLGPQWIPINMDPLQTAIDTGVTNYEIRTSVNPTRFFGVERSTGFSPTGSVSLRYELFEPDADRYHAIPMYTGSATSFDSGATFELDIGGHIFGSLSGQDRIPDRRSISMMEFDLSTLTADQRIKSATLHFDMVNNASSDAGQAGGLDLFAFGGDGTPTLDALDSVGNLIGNTGQIPTVRDYEFSLDPVQVEQLILSGETLGVLASPDGGFGQSFAIGGLNSIRFDRPELVIELADDPADAYMMSFTPTVDAGAQITPDETVTLDLTTPTIVVQSLPGNEKRSLLEFDLRALPDDLPINEVLFELDTSVLSFPGDEMPEFFVHAYAGDGVASAVDVLNLGIMVGQSGPVSELDPIAFQLDAAVIESLLSESEIVGLTLVGGSNGGQYGFDSAETFGGALPRLTVTLLVPEPSTLALAGMGLLSALAFVIGGARVRSR